MVGTDAATARLRRAHERAHRALVFDRRRERLAAALLRQLPAGRSSPCSVLDIGCGNGEIGAAVAASGHAVRGVETQRREECAIEVVVAPPGPLPFADGEFDWSVLVDVVHHAADADELLGEAARVARSGVVLKDHYAENRRQRATLAVMDWFGNRQFGVGRDGRYRSRAEWDALFERVGLVAEAIDEDLDLYPHVAKPVFERGLHFVARLRPR